ncbi:TetR/AcrR family transcriptional regulator [Pseudomonas aeruginosa]|uniref:TetR/AcrR family transcriptional regulator n=1 Tax=Pseudomonas aeruginosa TaxID=287 RepID=UPI000F5BB897|nr:TetR/AcrR family transcriptional regulator [Pseudomonas aeruginosa]RQJ10752.1 TetR family transcriptional regulator [Pseudomonas aeruginosa]HEJ3621332.1 TetR/AcrR family transcriptional regulator [Pseudomonas aeruginosa]
MAAVLGRPRTFDRDKAIQQAMHLFWQHGYESTSLNMLKASIGNGISAPSFYAAFGSKKALFQECVELYLSTHARGMEILWEADLAPRDAIETALRNSAKMQCEQGHPKGCMVGLSIMTAPSEESAAVTEPLMRSRARARAGFTFCISRGVDSGELGANTDINALASVFYSFLMGLSTLARDGVCHDLMDTAISHIMLVWDANASQRVF